MDNSPRLDASITSRRVPLHPIEKGPSAPLLRRSPALGIFWNLLGACTALCVWMRSCVSTFEMLSQDSSTTPRGFSLYWRLFLAGAVGTSLTHASVVPIDVVKTRLQVHPEKYNGMMHGFRRIVAEEGASSLLLGLGPTAAGYFMQGALKFGFYEIFKNSFAEALGPDRAHEYRTFVFVGSSFFCECIADLALCPMEATRIRLVSQPTYATGLLSGVTRMYSEEGFYGLYKGLGPILFKQVPYTIAKFVVFEKTSEGLYRTFFSDRPKNELAKSTQLLVSLGGGIIAGIAAAIISQPADTVLSKINQMKTEGSAMSNILRIMRDLGPRRLFLGLSTRILMVASLTAGQFLIYDTIKVFFGLPTTGNANSSSKK